MWSFVWYLFVCLLGGFALCLLADLDCFVVGYDLLVVSGVWVAVI